MRRVPTKHAAKILAAGFTISCELLRLTTIKPTRAQLSLAFVQSMQMGIDSCVGPSRKISIEDVFQHQEAIEIEQVLLGVSHAFTRNGRAVVPIAQR